MVFTIDKGIPAAEPNRMKQESEFTKTVRALEVGDSFFAPGKIARKSYSSLAPKKHGGKKFRIVDKTEAVTGADGVAVDTAGARVWRLS